MFDCIFPVSIALASTPPGMPGTHPLQYFGCRCYDLLATGLPCANRQTDRLAQTLVCKAAVRPMRGFVGCFGH